MIEECDSGTTSDFGSVSFTINRESRSKCLIEQPYTYWASHSATDLGFNNRVEDCPSHCANTAGCYAYHFERTNGKLNIEIDTHCHMQFYIFRIFLSMKYFF